MRGLVQRPFFYWMCGAALLLAGCASYTQEMRHVQFLYRSRSYDQALKELEASKVKDSDKNRLLYLLEKASILDRMGDRDRARTTFIAADKVVDELFTVSISKTAASYIVSDDVTDYEGEDYEKVAIHTFMALSFLEEGNLAAARVQARRINTRLNEINQAYEEGKNRYSEDAFARYLAGMIYESREEWDSAIVDYLAALKTYEDLYAKEFYTSPPDQLVVSLLRLMERRGRKAQMAPIAKRYPKLAKQAAEDLQNERGTGEIAVIHEVGHIANKEAGEFMIPIGSQIIRISFPYISYNQRGFGATGLSVNNGKLVRAETAQEMDSIAAKTLEDRRARMVIRQGVRLLAKAQLTEQARQQFGILGAIAANAFSAATETADTRSWTSLPSQYKVSRVRVPVGRHSIVIKTNDRITETRSVNMAAGQLLLLRSY